MPPVVAVVVARQDPKEIEKHMAGKRFTKLKALHDAAEAAKAAKKQVGARAWMHSACKQAPLSHAHSARSLNGRE